MMTEPGRSTPQGNEDGASATMFALVLLTLMSVAMLAIDGGSLFWSQRGQASDTDAAALAAARLLADNNCASDAAVASAATRLLENETSLVSLTVGGVEIDPDDSTIPGTCDAGGVVGVQSTRDADLFFAPLFGFDRMPTVVTSLAEYGFADVLPGVRPIALCRSEFHYQEWTGAIMAEDADVIEAELVAAGLEPHPDDYGSRPNGEVHRIFFERLNAEEGEDCSDANGNWGWLDFDSGGNSGNCQDRNDVTGSELDCRIRFGFEGGVEVGPSLDLLDCNVTDGSPDADQCAAQTGGAGNSTADALAAVTCDAEDTTDTCPLSIFVVYRVVDAQNANDACASSGNGNGNGNNGNGGGGGNNAQFCLYDLVPGVIWGADVGTGSPAPDNYLDVQFLDEAVNGPVVGGSDPGGTAPATYELCGARDFDNCNTSTN